MSKVNCFIGLAVKFIKKIDTVINWMHAKFTLLTSHDKLADSQHSGEDVRCRFALQAKAYQLISE